VVDTRDLPTVRDINLEAIRLSRKLDAGISELARMAREYAEAEHAYRIARACAYLQAPNGRVAERNAWVDQACSEQMLRVRMAEGLRMAALEAVRSRRQQLSALQSVARAVRAEMEMASYDQGKESR
jgi:hypothetical protein